MEFPNFREIVRDAAEVRSSSASGHRSSPTLAATNLEAAKKEALARNSSHPSIDTGEEDEGCYTVGVAFKRAVISAEHQVALHDAVTRVHSITLFATELANLVVRHRLEHDPTADLSWLFDANQLMQLFYAVSTGSRSAHVSTEVMQTLEHMPKFEAVSRTGLSQCLKYQARNLAAVAATNVWMHFRKRVLSHVRLSFALRRRLPDTHQGRASHS